MIGFELFKTPEGRQKIKESEKKRFKDESTVDKVWELYTLRNKIDFGINQMNKEMNKIRKDIRNIRTGKGNSSGGNLEDLEKRRAEIAGMVEEEKKRLAEKTSEIERLRNSIGNIVDESVPVGKDDSNNAIIRTFELCSLEEKKPVRGYADIMSLFTRSKEGAAIIGHRGYFLEGKMGLFARALKNYAIDFLVQRNYTYIQTPVMMRHDIMSRTAQLSDFDEQLYKVEDNMYLIATSEQPLSALFYNTTYTKSTLPLRYAGDSLCFRKEAGAYGKDNAGIFRVHQFDKVEQFVACSPVDSENIHNEMVEVSSEFYKSLGLSFRVVNIASGELNDAAAKKFDIEAYFPHSKKYRELVSASNCTDYQSRNLNAVYEYNKGDKKEYIHMLNATLCAIQRTLCCLVENCQEDDGLGGLRVKIPDVLVKYTGFDSIVIK